MTVAPSDLFLAAGNPENFLTDNLPSVVEEPGEENHHVRTAILIAGAFLAWRLFVVHKTQQEIPSPPAHPEQELHLIWTRFGPIWWRIAGPSILEGAARAGLSGDELQAVAVDYANRLGQFIHQSSATAVLAGYREQLRRGVNPTLSWMRSIEGYGLDERRLRSWVGQQAAQDTSGGELVSAGARRALDRAILQRADVLGQNEGWHLHEVAKSISWMYAEKEGRLPYGTRKKWLTAADEIVCPICGPVHEQIRNLDEKFTLPDGRELWAPGVHPNCRCLLNLIYPSINVEKALGDDPYNRDSEGQFATKESRTKRVVRPAKPVAEREVDPAVEQLVEAMKKTPPAPPVSTEQIDVFATDKVDVFRQSAPDLFAKPNIFPTVDVFPQVDVFSRVDVFGGTGGAGKPGMIYILIDGRPTPVRYENFFVPSGAYVFVSADDYYNIWDRYSNPQTGEPSFVPPPHKGQVIDFDEWGREAAKKRGADQPLAYPAKMYAPGDDLDKVIHVMGNFYEPKEYIPDEDGDDLQADLSREEDAFLRYVKGHKTKFFYGGSGDDEGHPAVPALTDAELQKISDLAGQDASRYGPRTEDFRETMWFLINGEPVSPYYDSVEAARVEDAFYWYLSHRDEDLQAIRKEIEDRNQAIPNEWGTGETSSQYLSTPYVFTFKHGVKAPADKKDVPYLTGKFKVNRIIIHTTAPVQTGIGRSNKRIDGWYEVELVPDDQEH